MSDYSEDPNDLGTSPPVVQQDDPMVQALLASGYSVQTPDGQNLSTTDQNQPIEPEKLTPTAQAPEALSTAAPEVKPPDANPKTQPSRDAAGNPVTAAPPPVVPIASGDVRAASRAQDQTLNTTKSTLVDAELAKTDALAAHADKRAGIYEGHALAQQLVDEQYERAREAARKDSLAEAATWQRDLDKKVAEEPVPGRWWHSQSKFAKAMWFVSLAFGAMAQAKNPNLKNIALEMMNKEMDDDMAEQKARIRNQIEVIKAKGQEIDKHLAAKVADLRDDHALRSSRLAIIQQAAMERANAPGAKDQQAAMAEAAQWAAQERLKIAGSRADKAYAEREGALNRDAENARALLTDKRDREIAAANIQKDYDLANIHASVQLAGKGAKRLEDSVVLSPYTTGIRVMNDDTGKPAVTPLSESGGLVVSKGDVEKQARQDASLAQDRYALLNRVSTELAKDDDIATLLRRNPQLVADLQKLGYQQARDNDPRGIVTDKDLISGMESALGGDLSSLSGRIAAGTFSAGQTKLKEVVDKAIRDMPAKVSNRLGSLIDAAIPGYEGKVRVDWSPKSVEIAPPTEQTSRQIDATYGIKNTIKAPESLQDLEHAQKLEAGGVEALPPYKPGSRDRVVKALEDFKNATPGTIEKRANVVIKSLNESGDKRAAWEVAQGMEKEREKALDKVHDLGEAFVHEAEVGHEGWYQNTGKIDLTRATQLAKKYGLGQMTGEEILGLIKAVGLKPKE